MNLKMDLHAGVECRSRSRLYAHTSAHCGGVGRDLGTVVALRASIYLHTAMVWGHRSSSGLTRKHLHTVVV